MNGRDETGTAGIDSIDILLFSMGEHRFALDIAQVARISEAAKKKGSVARFANFHEKMGFERKAFSYKAPKAIFLEDSGEEKAILIESPEDIISLAVGDIRPMPYLIDCCSKQKAIWGATFIDNEIILIVDLQKLQES